MEVPVRVTISSPDGQALTLDGDFVVNNADRVFDDGGHGEFRTYLLVTDEEAANVWCLTCVAEQMASGVLLSIAVKR